MNKHLSLYLIFLLTLIGKWGIAQEKVFPGADEKTPSRAQYFSWINNTNEGATEEHTMINLAFFEWLKESYGMQLDIYAFDAGAIDGAKFYGSTRSDRFKHQFPNGFDPMYHKAKELGIRLGVWGGPDGFGTTPEQTTQRIKEMVELCKKYEFELFKFDKVCGPLPLEKEDAFIKMMQECRKYSPDLILLNHRLGLDKGKAHATTFLWEGVETYTDCHIWNSKTATHHRSGALDRGFPPGFSRLTEDHGVCISSCLDAWDDELILQAFNRNLILAPEIYGNPWLLNDDEYVRLARIFNLHRQYRDIMVEGQLLPEDRYGEYAVARGNGHTRLITLRNNTWQAQTMTIDISDEIGITQTKGKLKVFQHHPVETFLGEYSYGQQLEVQVEPFRTCLLRVSRYNNEPYVEGANYQLVQNVDGQAIKIKILAQPGEKKNIRLKDIPVSKGHVRIDGKTHHGLAKGKKAVLQFEGEVMEVAPHRLVANMQKAKVPADAIALYESTCFAADNNALEVRSLMRSGETQIPAVKAARDAFFNQKRFIERGLWDQYLFDNDETTSFYVCRRRHKEFKINEGCFRLDMGQPTALKQMVIKYPDVYALQPLEIEEGIYAYVSNDLQNWEKVTGFISDDIVLDMPEKAYRYLKLPEFPDRMTEVIGLDQTGAKADRSQWRASNLFADYNNILPQSAWSASFQLNELAPNAYLCVAINGEHGTEGAYAALKVGERYVGAPDRSISYPSNTWESGVCHKNNVTANYTYYFPMEEWMIGKDIEAVVLVNSGAKELKPEVWMTTMSGYVEKEIVIE